LAIDKSETAVAFERSAAPGSGVGREIPGAGGGWGVGRYRMTRSLYGAPGPPVRTPVANSRRVSDVPRAHADGFDVTREGIGSFDAFRIANSST
jgi:hypothetical protein